MRDDPDRQLREEFASDQDQVEALREQLRAERRVAELSRTLLGLELDEIADWIRDALGAAARGAGADRAQLVWMKRDAAGGVRLDRYLWTAPGIEPIPDEDDVVALQSYSWSRTRCSRAR